VVQQITRPATKICRQTRQESSEIRESFTRTSPVALLKAPFHMTLARDRRCSVMVKKFSSKCADLLTLRGNFIALNPGFVPGNVLIG
jgi:hypothetical protein